MLRSLYALAQRVEGLIEDPHYEKKRIDFFLHVNDQGDFVSLIPTEEGGRALERMVPRMPKRTVNVAPGFLFDNAKYVLGLGGNEKDPLKAKRNAERNEECAEAFQQVVDEVASALREPGLLAVSHFLARRREQLPKVLKERPASTWTGSEQIAFVRAANGEVVHDLPAVRALWAARREREASEGAVEVRCLVTGAMAPPARMHGSVKRVPGAQTSGAALVSFNAEAFTSQGLVQGENAPVSRAAADGYVTALNYLLEGTPERRFRYGVPVGADAVTVFWTREQHEVVDVFADLFAPTTESAVRLAEAPLRGLSPAELDATPFYAATLSGNAARVVVRDWMETTVAEVKRNVGQYFDDLHLGNAEPVPVGIKALCDCIEAPGGRGLRPDLAARLFRAALRGEPFPRELLSAALHRLRLPPDKQWEARLLRLRCALIKATLLRLPRSGLPALEVSVSLDERSTQVPYLLGRLFAVLERLQGAALGDINATIRDRYFGAASATPALVFPRLLKLSVHHSAKAEGNGGWLERLKSRIMDGLPAERFPRTMLLEDQGLFAVGYYHQRERFFTPRQPTEAQLPAEATGDHGAASATSTESAERAASATSTESAERAASAERAETPATMASSAAPNSTATSGSALTNSALTKASTTAPAAERPSRKRTT
ncbi:type I-C CRISPR-associated protein Cas8c/Csd1 [Chondromyces crocatus]|uniref:CRISPR-associated protein Csd1 n=1 Tax=Chondromyces crocatus TaxID=52 RepID=A0A0K1EKW9_CHOCO|nr:type I-C CRISPR-associated protein Cas8c/Csd1 [Chondromyces crocatus]AKT41519.1 CRISPR-associated protein Csd1 [Chondromyces crocatus]